MSNPGVPTAAANKQQKTNDRILSDQESSNGKSQKKTDKSFPAEYYTVRKMRVNSQQHTELPTVCGDSRLTDIARGLPPGFENPGDDRHLSVKNSHIPALKKNVSSSVFDDGGAARVRVMRDKTQH
jgi:hypothetical protein